MPDQETQPSRETPVAEGSESMLSFREFLKSKAEESGLRDRHRRRGEWLGAVQRLIDYILDRLRESDPEGLLDIERYEVARTEPQLGTYDAPALKIRLGAAEVDVVPVSRAVPSWAFRDDSDAARFAGRVDIGDGLRKYTLYRVAREGGEHWQIRDEHDNLTDLDPSSLGRILQDLLS